MLGRDVLEESDGPVTRERIEADLRELGLAEGETVLVHCSLSSLGWVSGGAPAVVDALMQVVGRSGTIVMPTLTGKCTDPKFWDSTFDGWKEEIRESLPPFRAEITPTETMGAVAECFRQYPETRRSRHPSLSFAAWGADAEFVVEDHEFDYGLGERSPLSRVYDLDGKILLLGIGYSESVEGIPDQGNTSFHLAEYRADIDKVVIEQGGPVLEDGERTWAEFEDIVRIDEDGLECAHDFEEEAEVRRGRVGEGDSKLFSQPEFVDFAVEWLEENRD